MAWEGAALDLVSSAYGQYMASDRQEDMQSFNAEQAAIDRAFQERMSNTQYQRKVKDLIAADLNPMLAIATGGAQVPSGATASSGTASPGGIHPPSAGMQAASAAKLNDQLWERAAAETDLVRAQADEVRARTPTHSQSIEVMQQNIRESQERIQDIMQRVRTGGATESNLRQQTENLKALIPQIEATVGNIKAQTTLYGAQTGLARSQSGQAVAQTALAGAHTAQANATTGEIHQRVQQDLPRLEAALMHLQKVVKDMEMPRHQQDESVHEGFIGALSATMRALNPFTQVMPTVSITGTGAKPPPESRQRWKGGLGK